MKGIKGNEVEGGYVVWLGKKRNVENGLGLNNLYFLFIDCN